MSITEPRPHNCREARLTAIKHGEVSGSSSTFYTYRQVYQSDFVVKYMSVQGFLVRKGGARASYLVRACAKIPQKSWEFGFVRKISRILLGTKRELSVTLLFISTLPLFATLTGVCRHENIRRRLLLS